MGAGARTSVFAAEMRCTPRTLVAAPYKISGSPWSIAIAWPETADNCGRAVLGRPGEMDEMDEFEGILVWKFWADEIMAKRKYIYGMFVVCSCSTGLHIII